MKTLFSALFVVVLIAAPLSAQDMRELARAADQARESLAVKAREEKAAAEKAAAEARASVLADRSILEKTVAELEAGRNRLAGEVKRLEEAGAKLAAEETAINEQLAQTDGMIRELVGQIRINAKDLDTLISQNPQSAVGEKPASFLSAVAEDERFPGMDEVRAMTGALLDQIRTSGEVSLRRGAMIDRAGNEVEADILTIGPFTAAYRQDGETGFLNHASGGAQLYALSRLPGSRLEKQLARYMDGKDEAVPVDVSRGGALRQLTHQLSLTDQIGTGGPIVWPILAILVVGLLIVLERAVRLFRNRHAALPLIDQIREGSAKGDWTGCRQLCSKWSKKPLARVLLAGLAAKDLQREDMENVLQEAILKEIPGLERFLSTLGMLTAIAPLLGLLGTVTGMINVFHVITLHGASDPRLMSGGISEALVTTMLGLSVAIPLMLLHNVLSRTVDRMIGDMEEQSVALVNIIHKHREISC